MNKIPFENGKLVTPAKLNEDNTITPAKYEGTTPLSAHNLNLMQKNIENEINDSSVIVSSTEPTGENRKKIWIKRNDNLIGNIKVNNIDTDTGLEADFASFVITADYIPVESDTEYYASYNLVNSTEKQIVVYEYDENYNYLGFHYTSSLSYYFSTKSNTKYIKVRYFDTSLEINCILRKSGNKIYTKNSNDVYEEFFNADEVKNDYSLAERRIGTWIDGKPLYRKVIKGTTDSSTTSMTIDNVPNISTLVYSYGTGLVAGRYSTAINSYFNDSLHNLVQADINTGDIIFSYSQAFGGREYYIVLEYTKTTDVATTSLSEV